jgi:hypothetical protein
MYGSAAWALKKRRLQYVGSAEMGSVMSVKDCTGVDKILNLDIRSHFGIEKLTEKKQISKTTVILLYHVERMT